MLGDFLIVKPAYNLARGFRAHDRYALIILEVKFSARNLLGVKFSALLGYCTPLYNFLGRRDSQCLVYLSELFISFDFIGPIVSSGVRLRQESPPLQRTVVVLLLALGPPGVLCLTQHFRERHCLTSLQLLLPVGELRLLNFRRRPGRGLRDFYGTRLWARVCK